MQKAERIHSLLKQKEFEGNDYWNEILKGKICQYRYHSFSQIS